QVLYFIWHAQGSDESLVAAEGCRDALFINVQSGKYIVVPWYKRLVSHLSASFCTMEMLPTIVPSTEHSVSDNDIPHTSLRTGRSPSEEQSGENHPSDCSAIDSA